MIKIKTAGLYIQSKHLAIITSLAIHCIILSLLFTASAVQTIPQTDIINVRFVHNAPALKAVPPPAKAPQKTKVAPIKKISRKKITSEAIKPKYSVQNIIAPQEPLPAVKQAVAVEEKTSIPSPTTIESPEVPSALQTEYEQPVEPAGFTAEAEGSAFGPGGSTVGSTNGNQTIFETRFGYSEAPAFIHREIPVYPRTAKKLGKEGMVVLRLLIDAGGNLKDIEIVESSWLGFTQAAVDAVKRSTFSPGYRNGECVISKAILAVHFKLN